MAYSRSHYFQNLEIYGDESDEDLWKHEYKMAIYRKRYEDSVKESDLEVEMENEEECVDRSVLKEGRFDFDYSDCPKTITSKVLGSNERVVWTLAGIKSLIDLEAVASDAKCVVQMQDKEGKKVLLRFYFDRLEVVTKDDYRVRYLSLYVDVMEGDLKGGEGLNFVVRVDRLTHSLWTHFPQMPETAVFIRKPEDRCGKLVETYFLQYLRSPLPVATFRGQVNRSGFLLESTEDLSFGIKVTMINSVASKKEVCKEMVGVSLTSPSLETFVSSAMEKVVPPPQPVKLASPKAKGTSSPELKEIQPSQEIWIRKFIVSPPQELATPKLKEILPQQESENPKLKEILPPQESFTPKLMDTPLPQGTAALKLKEASLAAPESKESSFLTTKGTLSTPSTPKLMNVPPSDVMETPSPPKVFGRGRGFILNTPGPSSSTALREEEESPVPTSIYSSFSPSVSLVEEVDINNDVFFSEEDEKRSEHKYQVWPWNLRPKEDKGDAKLD